MVRESVDAFEAWRLRVLTYDKAYIRQWFPSHRMMAGCLLSGGTNPGFSAFYFGKKPALEKLEAVRTGKLDPRGMGIGADLGHNEITTERLARLAGTIPYEIVCSITDRVPRIYKK